MTNVNEKEIEKAFPTVSVVIPVYNAEDYLGQCLDSVLLQSLQDIEVICVDDGSTDGSLSILQMYAMFDERIKVIQQENSGAAVARNHGLHEATGKYIIFLDADDFFEEQMLEKMVAKAEEDGSDLVICGYSVFDDSIKETVHSVEVKEKYLKQSPFKPKNFAKELFSIALDVPWNKLIRRDLVEEKNILFDEGIRCVDDNFFHCCVMAGAKQISSLKDCFVYYRVNLPGQQTSSRGKYCLDLLKTQTHIYDTMKKLYGTRYGVSVIDYIQKALRHMLSGCSSVQKREGLRLIRKELSQEIFDDLFEIPSDIKVSIIIPVYNAAEFLPKCLDSCLNQTLQEIEIICIDDGSTDNSLEILNQYAQKDDRIIVLHQENQRQAIARNNGMKIARGFFIEFVDADDWIEPDTCECLCLYSYLFSLEMCQFGAIQFGKGVQNGELAGDRLSWAKQLPTVFNKNTLGNLLTSLDVAACFTFYQHDFLVRNNIHWINKKIPYEDTPFFTECILKTKRAGILDIPFYHRSRHSASTVGQLSNLFDEYIKIVKYTLERVEKWSNKRIREIYCVGFLKTLISVYMGFDNADRAKTQSHVYDLCFFIQKKYHLTLTPGASAFCTLYLKNQPLKGKGKVLLV